MPKLSISDIAQLGYEAGFRGQDLVIATAVAMAESGGNTEARGDVGLQTSTWGPSMGLMQIRSLNNQRGSGGVRDETINTDPRTNLKHAFEISNQGKNFSPWTTYTKGMYKQYLPEVQKVVAELGDNPDFADKQPGGGSEPQSNLEDIFLGFMDMLDQHQDFADTDPDLNILNNEVENG